MQFAQGDVPGSLIDPATVQWMCGLAERTPQGCFVEVGVYKGGAAWHLAKVAQRQGRSIYLYDTFTGIPFRDEIDAHAVGDFSDTSVEAVREAIPYASVVPGLFPGTLLAGTPGVAFAHIDVDQYRSTREAILALSPLMVEGGIMVFDDYGVLVSATTAVNELFDKLEGGSGDPKSYITF